MEIKPRQASTTPAGRAAADDTDPPTRDDDPVLSSLERAGGGIHSLKMAAAAISQALSRNKIKHAVVGGAALTLLGSTRVTLDIDLVLVKGTILMAKSILVGNEPALFSMDKRTRRMTFRGEPPIDIDFLSPPIMFRGEFEQGTPTFKVDYRGIGVEILPPIRLLDVKCGVIAERSGGDKKDTDSLDILYLLEWLKKSGEVIHDTDLKNASPEWVNWFVACHGHGDFTPWEFIGLGGKR